MQRDREIKISKEVLNELPLNYQESSLGDARGAKRQFRNGRVHVREYDDSFTIHIDHADPRKHPLAHLLKDSPETLASVFASAHLNRNKGDFFSLIASFFILNAIFRSLKEFVFG